jgi:predicted lipoprotein with Yx(FWY)xxD motif
MKYKTLLALILAVALILAACGPEETEVPTMTTEPTMASTEPATTEASETETADASPTAEATEAAETPTSSIPVTGEPTINVSESTEFGAILVDDEGLSLYIFMDDTQHGESSSCNDECAAQWPPLLSQGSPIAGEGVDSSMLGTVTRADGSLQVTYNGWPLYRFQGDTTLGETNGQATDNLWFLITPTGDAVEQ